MGKKLWNKDFILLLQGNAVSTIGDLMYSVAIGYWVYQQTGSSGLMGIMSAISMFVTMFLSPFAGSIVDKCNRKWVMVAMDLLQSAVMLTIGALAYLDLLNIPGVLIAAFLAAMGSVFYSPSVSTLMIDIIPHDDMVRGQSTFSGIQSLINMVGTAFSGVLVAFFGVPLIVVINGFSNLYSAFTELFVRVPKTVQQETPVTVRGVLIDTLAAAKTTLADQYLKIFVPCALLLNLLGAGAFALLLPFCMEKSFTVDMYGYLISIYSAACVIAVLLLGAVKLKPKSQFWCMSLGFTLSIPFMIAAYLSKSFVLICILAFVAGFLNCLGNSIFNASMMLALPEENRSAILGVFRSASVGGSALSAVIYGDLITLLKNQIEPYEVNKGDAAALTQKWIDSLSAEMQKGKGYSFFAVNKRLPEITKSFAQIPVNKVKKVKVGVVGEIYVKYSPLANNHLEEFLFSQGCEVMVPGLLGFINFKVDNRLEDIKLYGGNPFKKLAMKFAMWYLSNVEKNLISAAKAYGDFTVPAPYAHIKEMCTKIIGPGCKMGEGWLLTAEMMELIESGYGNIVCAQPFGCLPNHIVGKGMIRKLKEMYPQSNIVPIDYDPGATKVNQENRIRLMLAVAKENADACQGGCDSSKCEGCMMK